MHNIFLMFIILIQLTNTAEIVHHTESTTCQITFIDPSLPEQKQQKSQKPQQQSLQEPEQKLTNTNTNSLKLSKCIRKHCQAYTPTNQCKSYGTFLLQEQQLCYSQCCGSKIYNQQQCDQYNEAREIRVSKANQTLIIVLSVCLGGILIAIIIFMIRYVKCCKNYQEELRKQEKQRYGGEVKSSDIQIFWRPYKFQSTNKTCFICKQQQAFMMLPCQQYFHLNCLRKIPQKQWKCPHCSKNITKARIFCTTCCKYYLTIKNKSFVQLQEKINYGYQFHPQKCYDQIISQLDSDRKFTVSTGQ